MNELIDKEKKKKEEKKIIEKKENVDVVKIISLIKVILIENQIKCPNTEQQIINIHIKLRTAEMNECPLSF